MNICLQPQNSKFRITNIQPEQSTLRCETNDITERGRIKGETLAASRDGEGTKGYLEV